MSTQPRPKMANRAFTTPTTLPPIGDGPPSISTAQRGQSYKLFTQTGAQTNLSRALKGTSKSKCLVIFIRHFFCGNCQEYVRRIVASLPPESLPPELGIIVIGCGASSLIESYIELTRCPYPIYADPKTKLYKLLGMHRTLSLGSRSPSYIQHSLVAGMVKSVIQGVKRMGKGDSMAAGDLSVNGGEFLFWRDGVAGNWNVGWCHRMQNSRDHTEVEELRRHVGMGESVTEKTRPLVRRATTSNLGLQRRLSQRGQALVNSLKRSASSRPEETTEERKTGLKTISDERDDPVVDETKV